MNETIPGTKGKPGPDLEECAKVVDDIKKMSESETPEREGGCPPAPCYPYSRLAEIFDEAASIYAEGKHYGAALRAKQLSDAYAAVGIAEEKRRHFPIKQTEDYFG